MARTVSRLLFLAIALSACKKSSEVPDAGTGMISVGDEDLGFSMELGPDWSMGQVDRAKTPAILADARRVAPRGKTFLVAPRLVVTADPTDERDAHAVITQAQNDLRAFGEKRGVSVDRMAMSTRHAGSFEVGDVELAYSVRAGDSQRQVVQRSIMTRVPKKDASAVALTVTVTYMSDDAELIAPEVHRILGSLRLAEERK